VPLLGGIAIYCAFVLGLVFYCAISGSHAVSELLRGADFRAILGGATVVLLIGAYDDVRGLRVRYKFIACLAVTLAMYAAGFRIGGVSNPFGSALYLGWIALPLTAFWFLGCMNAINLIDGMDGLAAGIVFFATATLFTTSVLFGNASAALICAALAGAVLGFLFFNFHPASIFLGDCGSLLLGFLLACIGVRSAQKSQMVVALLIPVIALGLPIMDTALAIVRRRLKSLPFSASDRQHIHHKLLEMGLNHRSAVLVMYAACVVFGGLALLMTAANSLRVALALGALAALTIPAMRLIGRHEYLLFKRKIGAYVEHRRQGAALRAAAYVASASMRNADSVESLWQTFARAAERMEFDEASLTVFGPKRSDNGGARRAYRWKSNGSNGNKRSDGNGKGSPGGDGAALDTNAGGRAADVRWTAVFPLHTNGTRLGQLHVHKHTNGHPLTPEVPETLQLLTKALSINLDRVRHSAHPPQSLESVGAAE
jgi:UDP-GlcNAc:undecaprenyl-phosphate GlcNAc-1-phosphate transferase